MADEKQKATTAEKAALGTAGMGLVGSIVSIVPDLTAQFNKGYQNNQLAIAEQNARAAEANATAAKAEPKSNTMIWVGVIVAVLIIAILLIRS